VRCKLQPPRTKNYDFQIENEHFSWVKSYKILSLLNFGSAQYAAFESNFYKKHYLVKSPSVYHQYWSIKKQLSKSYIIQMVGFRPFYRPRKVLRVRRGIALPFSMTFGTRWGSAPSLGCLYPRERLGTHCTGGRVGPRAGLYGRKISSPPGFDPGQSSP